ncbi:hypothetical protein EYF80_006294 [Liparis tanakae]|uniref:Uncharacterized protein n=1 Tax=Liparis tanakae TaxID=230148 RepID=A0A4Z2J1K3_9TELE|nr:hypothetical protein EYF80_006294 [Liparis tanakae]
MLMAQRLRMLAVHIMTSKGALPRHRDAHQHVTEHHAEDQEHQQHGVEVVRRRGGPRGAGAVGGRQGVRGGGGRGGGGGGGGGGEG